jgi:large subunit ribosomal protein L16
MLMPKKTKFRKMQKGRLKGLSKGARTIAFGNYALLAVEPSWVTARQIEALRVAINRKLKKGGTVFLRMFPDKPISKKPAETRMGKGKGTPEFWVAVVKRGRVIVELGGEFQREEAKQILQSAAHKLPLKTRFIEKSDLSQSVVEG